jgi:hypothetical protein
VVCGPSHADAGPWQLSQLTPSLMSNVRARCDAGTSIAWHARHFGAVFAAGNPRMRAMRTATGPLKTVYAFECLSCVTHVLYSFCQMRVCVIGRTLPWHAGALQPPAPTY